MNSLIEIGAWNDVREKVFKFYVEIYPQTARWIFPMVHKELSKLVQSVELDTVKLIAELIDTGESDMRIRSAIKCYPIDNIRIADIMSLLIKNSRSSLAETMIHDDLTNWVYQSETRHLRIVTGQIPLEYSNHRAASDILESSVFDIYLSNRYIIISTLGLDAALRVAQDNADHRIVEDLECLQPTTMTIAEYATRWQVSAQDIESINMELPRIIPTLDEITGEVWNGLTRKRKGTIEDAFDKVLSRHITLAVLREWVRGISTSS